MFDVDLARRLNRPGPRYTSYPTAPHFRDGFPAEAYVEALETATDGPLALYVHVPFCAALCHYCGCHTLVTHRPERVSRYVGYLLREAELVAVHVPPGREVVQVHWGGGTPNTLSPEEIETLMGALRARFRFAEGAECALEGDPRTLTPEHLRAARRAGFRRLSLGVQTFDPVVQEAIGRVQPYDTVAAVVASARRVGFTSLNLDLLYGLPHQTPARFARTLERAVQLAPERLAVFGYAHVPWLKRHQRLIPEDALPGPEERLELAALAAEWLTDAGYVAIGMDHYARPDDALAVAFREGTLQRNFQGYTTHAGSDLVGLGLSAISAVGAVYAQNTKGLAAYYAALDAAALPVERGLVLSAEDRLRRYVIHELMCRFVVDKRAVEAAHGVVFDQHFADALEALAELEALGVVALGPDRIAVTERGRPFVRNVAMAFDAYLAQERGEARYSQTV